MAKFVVKTQAEVAEFMGVSLPTIAKWIGKGMPGSPGAYDLSAIFKWYRQERIHEIASAAVGMSL